MKRKVLLIPVFFAIISEKCPEGARGLGEYNFAIQKEWKE